MVDFSALIREEAKSSKRTEWSGVLGGENVTLYAKQLTPADNEIVLRKYPDFNTSMNMAGMAMYIAVKAEDESGKKVFSVNRDLPVLKTLGQDKIGEIFSGLFRDQVEAIDSDADGHEDRVGN